MTNEPPAQRLGRLVRARRKALKKTQSDIQNLGGPSTATQRLIEGGKHTDFRDGTGAALEAALEWSVGSIDAVLAGDEPTDLHSPTMSAPDQPPDIPVSQAVMDDLINTVGRTRESPPIDRAAEIFRVIAASVNITRNTLIHDPSSAGRDNAITSIYAATNAIPYMRDALNEMKGNRDELEATSESSASPEGQQDQEVTVDDDEESARPAGDHHPPSSPESSAESGRSDAAKMRQRIPRPADVSQRGKHSPGLGE